MVLKWEKRTFIIEIFIKKIEINRGIMGSSTQSPGVMLVTNVLKNKRFYHLIINWRIFWPNRIWTNARHIVNGFIVHHEPTIPLAQTHKPEPTSSTLSQVWYINYLLIKGCYNLKIHVIHRMYVIYIYEISFTWWSRKYYIPYSRG